MNTSQLDIWTSEFGARYTDRNDKELPARRGAWAHMLRDIPTSSILEVGCNVGWNLSYLHDMGREGLAGIEPQSGAVDRAKSRLPSCDIRQGNAFDLPFPDAHFDLVFTSGVLIHIHPDDVKTALDEMYRVSRRYILYIEYDADEETPIHYRGVSDALWKRDHEATWRAAHPRLTPLRRGHWGMVDGYDSCGWCLFEKALD